MDQKNNVYNFSHTKIDGKNSKLWTENSRVVDETTQNTTGLISAVLDSFLNRNCLLVDQQKSQNFTVIEKFKSGILGTLNESINQSDKDMLGKYGVFNHGKSSDSSYIMFEELIKFVKLKDKNSYLQYIKRIEEVNTRNTQIK